MLFSNLEDTSHNGGKTSNSIVEHRESRQVTPYDTTIKSIKKEFIDESVKQEIVDNIMSIDDTATTAVINELDIGKGIWIVRFILLNSKFL